MSGPAHHAALLLETALVTVRDVHRDGGEGPSPGMEAVAPTPLLLFPYRGLFVRRMLAPLPVDVVAEASQVLLVNAGEQACSLHPIPGGSGCLEIAVVGDLLAELVPPALLREGATPGLPCRASFQYGSHGSERLGDHGCRRAFDVPIGACPGIHRSSLIAKDHALSLRAGPHQRDTETRFTRCGAALADRCDQQQAGGQVESVGGQHQHGSGAVDLVA